jgi:hypothetical protein
MNYAYNRLNVRDVNTLHTCHIDGKSQLSEIAFKPNHLVHTGRQTARIGIGV